MRRTILSLIAIAATLLGAQSVRAAEAPYGGTPWPIPGPVQAENYDTGGQGVGYSVNSVNGTANSYRSDGVDLEATSDTGGGYDLGWTSGGQWFRYTVNVATAGTYTVAFRIAGTSAGTLHLQNSSGTNLTGEVAVPSTGGWQTWTTITAAVSLPAGQQVLTWCQDSGGYNVNYIVFATTPVAPSGLTATAGSAQVSLSWTAGSGASSYNVYRGTTPGGEGASAIATGITTTSYANTGLNNGTTYYYKVAAVNPAGTSALSNETGATPNGAEVVAISCGGSAASPFVADTDFNGGSVSGGTTHAITTTGVTNPAPQEVYQHGRVGNFTYTIPGLTAGAAYTVRLHFDEYYWDAAGSREFNVTINGTQVLTNFDIFKTAGAEYVAIIEPFAVSANSSGQIVIQFMTVINNSSIDGIEVDTPPSAPTGLVANAGNAQVTLSWTASSGATSYCVYRGTTSGGESPTAIAMSVTTTGYTDTGVTNGTTYYYRVSATNLGGMSSQSNEASARPLPSIPPAPTGLTAAAGNAQVALSWTASAGATSYCVYRGTFSGGEGTTPIAWTATNSYTDTTVVNETTYYYTVTAMNLGGMSGPSNEVSALPLLPEGPFGGTPAAIPGTVQAENYDTGGQYVGYYVTSINGSANNYRPDGVDLEVTSDTGGGYDLGWTTNGQWFRYTVNASAAGQYIVALRVAGNTSGGTLHLQNSAGTSLTGPITVPATGGWQTWTTVYAAITLPAGQQVITLYQDTGGYNVNYMTFSPYVAPPAPSGLAAVAGNAQNTLMWTPSTTETSYSVYRGTAPGDEGSTAIAIGVTAPNFIDTGIANGVTYYYVVTAVNFAGATPSNEASATPEASIPNFGSNVLIFNPSIAASTVQAQTDNVYGQQENNQFGTNRYALLFSPGTYNATVHVGFYTQVLGLGQSPNDVTITGAVQSNAYLANGNATQNFWRGAENLAIVPSSGIDVWAVSQACPMRRVHVEGSIILCDTGSQNWSSGGFLSDSLIDDEINSGSQQQWLSRNNQWGSWVGGAWNMVFIGDDNPPSGTFPTAPYTNVAQTPVSREKPFLMVDDSGNYSVFVPAIATNSQGTTWANGTEPGQSIPLSQFYIAQAGVDTASTINAALNSGLNLLLTPGVYELGGTIQVNNPNTVVLGLGIATLEAQNGMPAMQVADVPGVDIAGILFDAGATNSPYLLQVGPQGSSENNATNPICLQDLFFRVGGAGVGQAAESVEINSNYVIGDDFWVWRADHGSGVGWTTNVAANGLTVNGANDTIYGLAVEHYQQYQTLWNGNGGQVYFYQSEAPYDVPSDSAWMDGSVDGFASYKVANTVTSHQAYGLGIYCAFDNTSVNLQNAIEAPDLAAVNFTDMVTVSLGGAGTINSIINGAGPTASSSSTNATLDQYP